MRLFGDESGGDLNLREMVVADSCCSPRAFLVATSSGKGGPGEGLEGKGVPLGRRQGRGSSRLE